LQQELVLSLTKLLVHLANKYTKEEKRNGI